MDSTLETFEETLDSTLETLDWILETLAGMLVVEGPAFDETEDEEVFFAELLDFAEEGVALDELLDFLTLLLLDDFFADEVVLADEDEEVFLAELDEDLLVEELFLLEEVVFALVLLEDFEKADDVARNSGKTMREPPTRVVGATKRAPAGARSTRSASTA